MSCKFEIDVELHRQLLLLFAWIWYSDRKSHCLVAWKEGRGNRLILKSPNCKLNQTVEVKEEHIVGRLLSVGLSLRGTRFHITQWSELLLEKKKKISVLTLRDRWGKFRHTESLKMKKSGARKTWAYQLLVSRGYISSWCTSCRVTLLVM